MTHYNTESKILVIYIKFVHAHLLEKATPRSYLSLRKTTLTLASFNSERKTQLETHQLYNASKPTPSTPLLKTATSSATHPPTTALLSFIRCLAPFQRYPNRLWIQCARATLKLARRAVGRDSGKVSKEGALGLFLICPVPRGTGVRNEQMVIIE